MIPVDEARTRIVQSLTPVDTETLPVARTTGRVLRETVTARRTQPASPVSAMDGYAVRADDIISPPIKLTLAGRVAAGQTFRGIVGPGQAVRLFTGSVVPTGADTVIAQEDTEAGEDTVTITVSAGPGRHVRDAGRDFKENSTLIEAPARLNPALIALAAAGGWARLTVARRPRVAVLATGDELVRAGMDAGPAQTVASSLDGLLAALEAAGVEALDLGIAPDEEAAIAAALDQGAQSDLIVTLGGASVGDHDLIRSVLSTDGVVDFWRIAMRPGKPLMWGTWKNTPLLGLPGNPVSAMVCARLFLDPALEALQGLPGSAPATRRAFTAAPLPANGPREDYMRATLSLDGDGSLRVHPFPVQDSSMLSVLAASDALLVRPPHDPAVAEGAPCTVLPLASSLSTGPGSGSNSGAI